jgi:hypothetical protein
MRKCPTATASRTGWAAPNSTIAASSGTSVAAGFERVVRRCTRTVFARHPARLSLAVTHV